MEYQDKSTTPQDTPPDRGRSVPEQVLTAIRRLSRGLDVHSRALMRQWGLTGPQLMVLGELARRGELPAGRLAEAVSLSQATVSGIVDRLEKRGLVARRRGDADRRRVLVRPTAACGDLLRTAPPMLQESFVRQFEELADREQSQILSCLQALVKLMEAPPAERSPWWSGGLDAPGAPDVPGERPE